MKTYPKPSKVETATCKEILEKEFPGTKNWKRLSKSKKGSVIVRQFTDGTRNCRILETSDTLIIEDQTPTEDLAKKLVKAAAKIRHCGDYGHLYYNAKKNSVWWVGGDSDGDVLEGYTDLKEIKKMLKLPGIRSVQIEAECSPEENKGWKDLGRCGQEIYIAAHDWAKLQAETKPETGLVPGFMYVEFEKGYFPSLVHHTNKGTFSFDHAQIYKPGEMPPCKRYASVTKAPAIWNEAIADIYKQIA